MFPSDPFKALVDFLPKSAKASYGFIRSLAKQEPALSGNQIQEQLSAAGYGINRQLLQGIVATLRNKADIPQFVRTFGENAILPPSLHTISATPIRSGHKVVYEVGTNSQNPNVPESVYVGSNAPLSADQVYGAAAGLFTYEQGSGMASSDLPDVVFTIDRALYSPGLQTTGEYADNTNYSGA
jgi:hypothetical protein